MPNAVFLILGTGAIGLSYLLNKKQVSLPTTSEESPQGLVDKPEDELLELDWDDAGQVDVISVELGYGLIPLIEEERHGRLLHRAKGIRKNVG